jgi:hypothetical protein
MWPKMRLNAAARLPQSPWLVVDKSELGRLASVGGWLVKPSNLVDFVALDRPKSMRLKLFYSGRAEACFRACSEFYSL